MSIKLFKYMNGNKIRIPKSWMLLFIFIVSVIVSGAYIFTTPPNGITDATGSRFVNTSNDANNYTADAFYVNNGSNNYKFVQQGYDAIISPYEPANYIVSNATNIDSLLSTLSNKTVLLMPGWYITDTIYQNQTIIGADVLRTVVQSSDINTKTVTFMAGSSLQHATLSDAYIYDPIDPGAVPGALRPILIGYFNNADQNRTASHYPYEIILADANYTSSSVQRDKPQIAVNQWTVGDGFFCSGLGNKSTCLRINLNAQNNVTNATGVFIQNFGDGKMIWLLNKQGASDNPIRVDDEASQNMIELTHLNNTAPSFNASMVDMTSSNMQTGNFINLFQSNSVYNGTAIQARLGSGTGSCASNANFVKFINGVSGKTVYTVDCSGNETVNNFRINDEQNQAMVTLQHINTSTPAFTNAMISGTSNNITTGQFINLFQSTNIYSGNAIQMNFGASGGSFTGNYILTSIAGVTNYAVKSTGNVTMPHYNACQQMQDELGFNWRVQINHSGMVNVTNGTCI